MVEQLYLDFLALGFNVVSVEERLFTNHEGKLAWGFNILVNEDIELLRIQMANILATSNSEIIRCHQKYALIRLVNKEYK